jgi:hypothetical protein
MSNYTKLIAYDTKDGLTTGDPLKRIKGTEFDDEFDAISVAIATKANSASPEFTGTPTVPTASVGTNTTQAASTAFVQAALATLYPVGSLYINATNAINPATLLGFGTWSAFAAGRVPIGNGGGFSAGATGGSADAIVVSHSHSATSTDSGHLHTYNTFDYPGGYTNLSGTGPNRGPTNTSTGFANITTTIASTGSSGTNANLQPYIVVYMWQRTA